jgi:hypothetical protein
VTGVVDEVPRNAKTMTGLSKLGHAATPALGKKVVLFGVLGYGGMGVQVR